MNGVVSGNNECGKDGRGRRPENKLAKARKTRKSPGTLGLKNFGLGKVWVEKVWAQNIFIDFLANILENIFVNF